MGNRKDKIETKYAEYKLKFAGKTDEEMQNSIKNLELQIEEKTANLKKEDKMEEKEKLEAIIAKMKQERDNMSGYNKNKDKIEKIRKYKGKLNEKLENLKEKQTEIVQELKANKEASEKRLEEINKVLGNSKETEKMDQNEYNDLLVEKEKIENETKEIKARLKEIKKKIEVLRSSVSKCDLAWRSLFNDKTWDEIQVRALNNKKYIKKEKNEISISKGKGRTKPIEIESTEQNPGKLIENDEFAKKHPILAKIRDLFRKAKEKIVNPYSDYKKYDKESKETKKAGEVEKTNETKERDAFIEELRRHVENDKADKEMAYIEKHKIKTENKKEEKEEAEVEKWRESEEERKNREQQEIDILNSSVNENIMREILVQGEKERERKIKEEDEYRN